MEIKTSTAVKSHHVEEAAIQTQLVRESGHHLHKVSIAHINSRWTYAGDGVYRGLFTEADVTDAALSRSAEVQVWISEAQQLADQDSVPEVAMGGQCHQPFSCGFFNACSEGLTKAEFPVEWLPRVLGGAKSYVLENSVTDMREIPEDLLNPIQARVRNVTVSGRAYFDKGGAREKLKPSTLPAYFIDFETISFAVPRWRDTRPFQALPFQFSVHRLDPDGQLGHQEFLDLSGSDPRESFAEALICSCPERIPVFVYNASFERARLKELAERFESMSAPLLDISGRLVDLLTVSREYYYHPEQKGSWSIKDVLAAISPEMSYANLTGVRDGSGAMTAYRDYISPETSDLDKSNIKDELLRYCKHDTRALVELWRFFTGFTGRIIEN